MTTFPTDRSGEMRPKLTGEYDALADLFLGGDDAPQALPSPALRLVRGETPAVVARAPQRVEIEAMLLGSLPIYASAWVTQFVRSEASRLDRPVALVRTLAGEGSVDLLGGPIPPDAAARRDTFEGALAAACASCGRVVIRAGETSEADLASHERVGSVALLTGVDEPALIAAYRTLKILAPRWATRSTPPVVRVAAMGASDEQGRRAFEKIARAARVFLETPIEYAGSVERIEPAPTVCLFRGPVSASLDAVIESLHEPPRNADCSSAPAAPVAPSPEPAAPEPCADTTVEAVAPAEPAATSDDVIRDALTDRVPGLARIAIAVPRCEGVELAADASGGLHLIARDDESSSPTASLLAAQAWASINRELLAAACATLLGSPVDASRPATLHLFTDQPKRVRSLLDADIRVHFLGSVEMNGKRAWCVAELN